MSDKVFRILAIDGGGIRGLIPATFLSYMETEHGKHVCQLFDFIVGTSTGGIIALGLAHPAGFAAKQLGELYRANAREIFPASNFIRDLFSPKYDGSGLRRVLSANFGEAAALTSAIVPVCVTSFDLVSQEPVFLASYSERPWSGAATFYDAACATSAGETFFPAHGNLIDGGNVCNNPSVVGLAQSCKLRGTSDTGRVKILSLGTGRFDPSLANLGNGGELAWAANVSTVTIDGVAQRDTRVCERLLGERYLRIQPQLTKSQAPMDNIDVMNMATLQSLAAQAYSDNAQNLKEFLDD